jgi:hypothetical protein
VNIVKLCLLLFVVLFSSTSHAEALSPRAFHYEMGNISYLARMKDERPKTSPDYFANWNPGGPKMLKPGLQIDFWGRANGCDPALRDGPVSGTGNPLFDHAQALTAIALDPDRKDLRWSPSGNSPQCERDITGETGPAFVHVNTDREHGGIGLYTHTGPLVRNGAALFWGPFGQDGQNGKGANRYVEGTFVVFRFDWRGGNTVRPWSGHEAQDGAGPRAVLRTTESVSAYDIEFAGADERSVTQLNQHFGATFLNTKCMADRPVGGICMLKYVFHTAIMRKNVARWDTIPWFNSASLLLDPVQGGMPVFIGPLKQNGEKTLARSAKTLDLWTSQGAATRHSRYPMTAFQAAISFRQLKNALVVAASRLTGRSTDSIAVADIAKYFGSSWSEADTWVLVDFVAAQEIHNTDMTKQAYLGGGYKEIFVGVSP